MSESPVIEEFDEDRRLWLETALSRARVLCADAGQVDALALDQCIERWYDGASIFPVGDEDFVEAMGCAFGSLLAERASLRWVMATDDFGADAALYRGSDEALVFPISSVAKRLTRHERRFIWPMLEWFVDRLQQVQ